MWPSSYALTEVTASVEKQLRELVTRRSADAQGMTLCGDAHPKAVACTGHRDVQLSLT
jgi:hypothetical protein